MNSKMTTNSQLSTTEPKKKKKIKQTSKTGMESQKWISHGGLSVGRGQEEDQKGQEGEKVEGIRNINGKYKIDRGKLIV